MTKSKKNLTVIKQNTAGIDIGSKKIFIGIANMPVTSFDTFTSSYKKAIEYLKENNIKSIAMRSLPGYIGLLFTICLIKQVSRFVL